MQLKSELLEQIELYIKNSADAEKDFYKKRIRELYTEDTKLKNRMDRLMDLFLDGELDKTAHEEKRLELVEKRQKVIVEIEAHHKADDSFIKMLISLVGLASNALQTFSCSNIEEKRGLINLVFANLTLSNEKLDYSIIH